MISPACFPYKHIVFLFSWLATSFCSSKEGLTRRQCSLRNTLVHYRQEFLLLSFFRTKIPLTNLHIITLSWHTHVYRVPCTLFIIIIISSSSSTIIALQYRGHWMTYGIQGTEQFCTEGLLESELTAYIIYNMTKQLITSRELMN